MPVEKKANKPMKISKDDFGSPKKIRMETPRRGDKMASLNQGCQSTPRKGLRK